MSQKIVIEVKNLAKQYGSDIALSNISFSVKKGEIFALLGSDNSGKTSLIEILEGLRKPTSGEAIVLGFNINSTIEMREIKKIIGTLPQDFKTYDNLTVKENIQFWGKMYDFMLNPDDLMTLFNLNEYSNVRYKKLPNNIKRKVAFVITLVNDPELVFLDEPTAGMDQYTKKEIWDLLLSLREKGKTVFLTTNHALEPQAIADRVAILHQGSIKDIGSPEELIDRYSSEKKFIIRCPNVEVKRETIAILDDIPHSEDEIGDIFVSSDEIILSELLEKLERANVKYSDVITQRPTLNDVFLVLTGHQLKRI
ncbi:MAG TPA: ABC transporter ATP-binding protein [candidate division Zixibacteria bacterium]|nr:ABC transporter ATP-binding protein [candidate division Zixibacteria bacterium]